MGGHMPLLDKPVLDRLTADVGEESAAFLIGSLKNEISRTRDALEDLAAKGDLEQVEIQAHALKSAARSFGAMKLGETCYAIEQAAKASSQSKVNGLLVELRSISADTISAFG